MRSALPTWLAGFVLSLSAVCSAQTPFTSPGGLLSTEGPGMAYYGFGSHPDGRLALMDGELRGQAMLLKGIATRPDYRLHSASSSQGRTWKTVTLDLYECDHDGHGARAVTRSFQGLALTTPTRLFSGSVSWATLTGRPASQPAGFSYRFPFSQSWQYSGQRDLCADWQFHGGQLRNQGSWGKGIGRSYFFDAPGGNAGYATGKVSTYGTAGLGTGCVDGNNNQSRGAYAQPMLSSYNGQFDYKPYRNRIRGSISSYLTAPGAPVYFMIGTLDPSGIRFGSVTCNRLHLRLNRPLLLIPRTANASLGYANQFLTDFPYTTSVVGYPISTQSAWADSRSGELKFSRAASALVPAAPPPSFRRRVLYQPDPSRSFGNLSNDPTLMPVLEFRR